MTKGWNGHRNKSQHRRITLEKENSPANPTQRMEPRCNNPSWHKIYMLYFHSKLRMSKGTDAQSTHSKILMQIMTKGTDARSTHSKILMQITDYNSQGDNQMDRCLPCSLLHTQSFKGVQNNDRPYMKKTPHFLTLVVSPFVSVYSAWFSLNWWHTLLWQTNPQNTDETGISTFCPIGSCPLMFHTGTKQNEFIWNWLCERCLHLKFILFARARTHTHTHKQRKNWWG